MTTPNPLLKKLGFSDLDRLVIIHADDIGMCQASVQAFRDLWSVGGVSSGAVMVPCPWFPAAAQMCRENPEIDMGVHATLNSEWDAYRWAPLTGGESGSGLRDEAGYFHQWHQAVYDHASMEEVELELKAQIEKALKAGIDVTHVDSHMGTIMNPKFIQAYLQAAGSRVLPNMLPRLDAVGMGSMDVSAADQVAYAPIMQMLENIGVPMLNGLMFMPLDQPRGQMEIAKTLLGGLPIGITHFILHPSIDTPELRAICPDFESRVANYETFMSDEIRKFIEREGIQPIGYRAIRDAMRI